MAGRMLGRLGLGVAGSVAVAGVARADASPLSFMGDPVIAIGVIVVLVLLLWLFIRGVLSIAGRDKSDEDDAGVGVLEGIDEDDDKPKRR
jgi:hypothetical protein